MSKKKKRPHEPQGIHSLNSITTSLASYFHFALAACVLKEKALRKGGGGGGDSHLLQVQPSPSLSLGIHLFICKTCPAVLWLRHSLLPWHVFSSFQLDSDIYVHLLGAIERHLERLFPPFFLLPHLFLFFLSLSLSWQKILMQICMPHWVSPWWTVGFWGKKHLCNYTWQEDWGVKEESTVFRQMRARVVPRTKPSPVTLGTGNGPWILRCCWV